MRVIRACRELGIPTVAVYSDADRDALHVEMADRAERIGPASPGESYLNTVAILEAARRTGATLIHPGYGFLSENPDFARACAEAGLTFIGPPPEAMERMGDKAAARRTAESVGVPVVPGVSDPVDASEAVRVAEGIGFPIAVKAAHGGGGRGMHLVREPGDLEEAVQRSAREAQAYFGRPEVYLERYIDRAHHVEAQILADGHGSFSFLGERDCSLQRRYQKLVEESPSPVVDADLRTRIGEAALAVAKAAGYVNAGTVEFLVEDDGSFYFLEVNARLQVEHPVTELVTGLDLVRLQIEVALGERVEVTPDLRGHAIECRINAEDVSHGFRPAPGRITHYREPAGPGVRVDSGVAPGAEITPLYDPMIAKLIVHGVDREHARRRMLRALAEFEIGGVKTLLGFHRALLEHQCFVAGETCDGLVESEELAARAEELTGEIRASHDGTGRLTARPIPVEVEGRRYEVTVLAPEPPWLELARARKERVRGGAGGGSESVVSPMQGTVLSVAVADGDAVEAGQVVCIVEAMKMENEIAAHRAGVVTGLSVRAGEPVQTGQVICVVAPAPDA